MFWNLEVLGREADDLIRETVRLGGGRALESPPLNLTGLDPRYFPAVDISQLETKLRVLRDRLRAEAIERGWEVDQL